MTETLTMIGYALGTLALFTALGSGPAICLMGDLRLRWLICAPLGLAVGACLASTAEAFLPMSVAIWALIVPAALASVAWAVIQVRAETASRPEAAELAVPAGLGAVGVALAILPAALHGTVGPFGLASADAFNNVFSGLWLHGHSLLSGHPSAAQAHDLALNAGYGWETTGQRPGFFALQSGVAVLLGTGVDSINVAFGAAVLALMPATVWLIARELGCGRFAAAFGAAFGLSPGVLMLIGDSAIANLAGLVLGSLALAVGTRAVSSGEPRRILLTALLVGGFIGVYSELLLTLVSAAAIGALAFLAVRIRAGAGAGRTIRTLAIRLGLIGAGALVVAPVAAWRAEHWLRLVSQWAGLLPIPRHLTIETSGAWAFGVLHLYELQRFDLLSTPKAAAALVLPALLLGLVAYGVLRSGARAALVVVAPTAAAILLGIYSRDALYSNTCEYCQWKQWTFMLPFLAVGLALGIGALARFLAARGVERRATALTVGGLAAVALAFAARSDGALTDAVYNSQAYLSSAERRLPARLAALPGHQRVVLEGTDATAFPVWDTAEGYFLARQGGARQISLEPNGLALIHLIPASSEYYSPRYRYVITTFGGIRSNRRLVGRDGAYTIFQRAPVDVTLGQTGWSVDTAAGAPSTPSLQGSFTLRISSPRAQGVAVSMRIAGPYSHRARLRFMVGRRLLALERSGENLCFSVPARRGGTKVVADLGYPAGAPPTFAGNGSGIAFIAPLSGPPLDQRGGSTVPEPPRLASIVRLQARSGECPAGRSLSRR